MQSILLEKVNKRFMMGENVVHALRDISLHIEEGEFVAIMGPSGSGKSTLMNLLGCLDQPDSGRYLLQGQPVCGLSRDQLAAHQESKNRLCVSGVQSPGQDIGPGKCRTPIALQPHGQWL